MAISSVCPSVCHTHALYSEHIIEILSLSDRHIILVFCDQGFLRKSDGFTPNGGAEYEGGSDFRLICGYISETVTDRGIFSIEDEYKVVCAPSNSATFGDLQWPRTPAARSQYSLKANISQTVHPIHSMFCSRLWFFGKGRSNGAISDSIKSKMAITSQPVCRSTCYLVLGWGFQGRPN